MPEENKNRNFDSFLNEKIRLSLESHASSDFIFEMLKRVELEKEFEKEDVKTYKMAKYIVGGFVSLLTAFVIVFTFLLNSGEESKDASFFNSVIDKFSNLIESISIFTTDTLGVAFDFQTGLIIFLVMICVFLFSFADKMIFKKGFNK